MVLWFLALGFGLSRISRLAWTPLLIAALLDILSTATSFNRELIGGGAALAGVAAAGVALGAAIGWCHGRLLRFQRRHALLLTTASALALAMAAYVQWHAYVEQYRAV